MGKKQEAGNLTHFGYQILPKMLQEWCKGHNLQTTRKGMTPEMRKVSEMHNVFSLELVEVISGGYKKSHVQETIKTQRMSNAMEPSKTGYYVYGGNSVMMSEIKQMIKSMESAIMTKMDIMETKIDAITNQRNMEEIRFIKQGVEEGHKNAYLS